MIQEFVCCRQTPSKSRKTIGLLEAALARRMQICTSVLNRVFGQHAVDLSFVRLNVGANPCGVFGVAPVDLMHACESGLVPLLLNVLIEPLPNSSKIHLHDIAENFFCLTIQGQPSARSVPKLFSQVVFASYLSSHATRKWENCLHLLSFCKPMLVMKFFKNIVMQI